METAAEPSTSRQQPHPKVADIAASVLAAAEEMRGVPLQRLGYDETEADPDLRAQSLRRAASLAGAMHWSCEILIDELFHDIHVLRQPPGCVSGTLRIGDLPPLHAPRYNVLFAQRFLTVAVELGAALVTAFHSPTCVAQELALLLVLDGVEGMAATYPELELAPGWRNRVEESLFQDSENETAFDRALHGTSAALDYPGTGNPDPAFWFDPFAGRGVNPYAANDPKPFHDA